MEGKTLRRCWLVFIKDIFIFVGCIKCVCRERSKKIDPSYQLATVAIKGKIDPTFISLILLHKYSAPHNNKTFLAREHGNWLKMSRLSSKLKEKNIFRSVFRKFNSVFFKVKVTQVLTAIL